MKVYNPENKWNIVPKAFSIFPLFAALVFLHFPGIFFQIAAVVFFLLTVYTFFFTKYDKYLDTENKTIHMNFRWLFVKRKTVESVANYKCVAIALGGSVSSSNWQSLSKQSTYDVLLAKQGNPSLTHTGFAGINNFLLATHLKDIDEAKEMALSIGDKVGLPVEADRELVKALKYNPLSEAR